MVNNPKYILIHCSDVSYKTIADQFESINAYHRDVRGFNRSSLGYNVGYHVLITGGKAYKARIDTEYGNHCNTVVDGLSMNFKSLGICIGFDGDIEYPKQNEYDLLKAQVKAWQKQYNIPDSMVFFHHKFNPEKTCAGSLLGDEWLSGLLSVAPPPKDQSAIDKQAKIIELQRQIGIVAQMVEALRKLIISLTNK